jgi:hypothetical protein
LDFLDTGTFLFPQRKTDQQGQFSCGRRYVIELAASVRHSYYYILYSYYYYPYSYYYYYPYSYYCYYPYSYY